MVLLIHSVTSSTRQVKKEWPREPFPPWRRQCLEQAVLRSQSSNVRRVAKSCCRALLDLSLLDGPSKAHNRPLTPPCGRKEQSTRHRIWDCWFHPIHAGVLEIGSPKRGPAISIAFVLRQMGAHWHPQRTFLGHKLVLKYSYVCLENLRRELDFSLKMTKIVSNVEKREV